MIIRLLCISLLLILGINKTVSAEDARFKPRLGCVPFLATSLQAMAFTENISSSLLDSIDRTGHFEVVERKKIESFIEIEGQRLDNLNHEGVVRIGLKAGLDYFVYGSVSMTDVGASLDVNLIAIRSKKSLLKETFRISESDFNRQLQTIAAEMVNKVKQQTITVTEVVQVVVVPQPKNLSVSGTSNSIRLTWQINNMEQIAGFNIYRSIHAEGPFSLHGTATEPLFIDDQLKLNEVFYYRISAVNKNGSISDLTAAVPGATVIAPPAPIFLNIHEDIKGARLLWRARPSANSDPGTIPSGFKVYRQNDSDNTLVMVVQLPLETLEYYDNALKDGVKYIYSITACNSQGAESELSSRLSVTPLSAPKQLKPLSGRIRQVPVSWDVYSGESAVGYVLYRSNSHDGTYLPITKMEAKATAFTDRNLADNTTYWYRLSAYKKDGIETDPSVPVSALTRDVPPKPVNLVLMSGQPRKVTLKWQNAGGAEDEITKVLIYRSVTATEMTFEKIDEIEANNTSYIDEKKTLLDKTGYSYRIRSYNSGGAVSLLTDTGSATTKAPPEIPSQFSTKSGSVRRVSLTWQKNRELDIKEYRIARKQQSDLEFKEIGSTAETFFEDIDLPDGAEVSYKIRVIDSDGLVSGFSGAVTAQTKPLPGKVTGLRIVDRASRLLGWQPATDKDVIGYIIYKKGFLGGQKVATVTVTSWNPVDSKEKAEYYVTALDSSGLQSVPSELIVFE